MKKTLLLIFIFLIGKSFSQPSINLKEYSFIAVGSSDTSVNFLSCLVEKNIFPKDSLSKMIVIINGEFILNKTVYYFDDCIFLAKNNIFFSSPNVSNERSPNTNEPVGIEIQSTFDATVECNTTDKTFTGVRISGSVNGLKFNGNSFADHSTGLRYASVTNNGANPIEQINAGNLWLGSYGNISNQQGGAYNNAGTFNQTVIQAQRYDVNVNGNPNLMPPSYFPNPFNSTTNWFPQTTTGLAFDCANSAFFMPPPNNPNVQIMTATAEGTLPAIRYQNEVNLQEQRLLYEEMKEDLSLHNLSTKVDSFYNASEANSLKDMYDAKILKEDIKEQATIEKEELIILKEDIRSIVENIFMLDSIHANDTIVDSLYILQKNLYLDSLNLKNTMAMLKENQIKQAEETKADESIAKYNSIANQIQIDYNTKFTDQVWMQYSYKNQSISSAEQAELWLIADQCPLAGGNGVYSARSLLNIEIDTFWIDYDRCLEVGYDTRKTDGEDINDNTVIPLQKGISIFPNPTNEILYIKFDQDYDKIEVEINGILGNSVYKKEINVENKMITLHLKNLSLGSYILNLSYKNKSIHNEKIIIE